jgi:hypothetical protein
VKNIDEEVLGTLISITITIVIVIVIYVICSVKDNRDWNYGYCDCGGQWEYEQAVGHMYHTSYLYRCNKCGLRQEFDKLR